MFKLIWNLLALLGLAIVAGVIWVAISHDFGYAEFQGP